MNKYNNTVSILYMYYYKHSTMYKYIVCNFITRYSVAKFRLNVDNKGNYSRSKDPWQRY